ncbi:alpha/beta fold hydrolase [Inquilinus sp. CAU 1745]|uniref:alpha/beta fold hydrolase n=1 Tax=Inquilinus sp. CAU 1745 TaxID=3140369 RepID=UPI00325A913B
MAATIRRAAGLLPLPGLALLGLALLLLLGGCASLSQPMGPATVAPRIGEEALVAADGYRLPLTVWRPEGEPRAVILALHGFNDYAHSFDMPATWWAGNGILTYAYDQRGFGRAAGAGIWAGSETLIRDARMAAALLRARHPDLPFYLLGESMGGAIAIALMASPDPPEVDGTILVAPAIWGREVMPFYQRWSLDVAVALAPGLTVTGEGLDIVPSDNIEMLIGLSTDPLVLKANRIDTLDGLVDLMSLGYRSVDGVEGPTLFLYGRKEEVLPIVQVRETLAALPPDPDRTIAFYGNGYHMLLRDLERRIPQEDILAWIEDRRAPLPSVADQAAAQWLANERVAGRPGS